MVRLVRNPFASVDDIADALGHACAVVYSESSEFAVVMRAITPLNPISLEDVYSEWMLKRFQNFESARFNLAEKMFVKILHRYGLVKWTMAVRKLTVTHPQYAMVLAKQWEFFARHSLVMNLSKMERDKFYAYFYKHSNAVGQIIEELKIKMTKAEKLNLFTMQISLYGIVANVADDYASEVHRLLLQEHGGSSNG